MLPFKPLQVSRLDFSALSPGPYASDAFDFIGVQFPPFAVPARYNEISGWAERRISRSGKPCCGLGDKYNNRSVKAIKIAPTASVPAGIASGFS
jgi:hypothetical protein